MVVSRGEIIDYGPYNELMNKSKILRDLVYSIESEQTARKFSDAGIVHKKIQTQKVNVRLY